MRIQSYREFWPYYLGEHSRTWTRRVHLFGTLAGIGAGTYLGNTRGFAFFPVGLLVAYGFAWVSHFAIERNKPATFRYPWWSFISDFRMIYCVLTGKIKL